MPEKLLEFLLDLSPQDAKQITAWFESNPFAVEQMIQVIQDILSLEKCTPKAGR